MTSTASEPLTNWLELPLDITINIFRRVGVIEIFENVEKVCITWRKICKDNHALWRVIKIDDFSSYGERPHFTEICKVAVDRSQGELVDLTIEGFGNAELLQYVAHRSSQLRRLEIAYCFENIDWNEALKKFPLLEELNLYATEISKEAIETAGRYCPMLKSLKVNRRGVYADLGFGVYPDGYVDDESILIGNEFAKAIGENLVELRHLELIGCSMSNVGLQVILDGCCQLESLDLRNCLNVDFNKDLLKRCSELLKHLKLSDESLEGCPYLHKYGQVINAYISSLVLTSKVLKLCDDLVGDNGDFEDFGNYDDYGFSF